MRKFFTLLTAAIFAGSLMAAEVQIYKNEGTLETVDGITVAGNINETASNGNPAPAFANTKADNNNFTFSGFSLAGYSNLRLSLDAKFASFPSTTTTWPYLEVKFYKSGEVVQTDKATVVWTEKDNTYKTYSISVTNDFDKIEMIGHPAEGTSSKGKAATSYALYIDNIILFGESSTPIITAENIDLGEVMYEPEEKFEKELSIAVVGANLSESISFSENSDKLSFKTADPLAPTGGTLVVAVQATAGELNEEIVLQSGATQKKVVITGQVFEKLYNPGTATTFATPLETDTAFLTDNNEAPYTVNGANAILVGTASKLGVARIKVPANATKVYFMAAAWAGKPCNILISAPEGVTLTNDSANNQGKTHIYADAGLVGKGPGYITAKGDWSLYQYELTVSGMTEEIEIELASTARSSARFFVWNATYLTSDPEQKSNDATIKSLTVNGQAVAEKEGVFAYEVAADVNLAEVEVVFTLAAKATADKESGFKLAVPASSEAAASEATINVTAEDGTTQKAYKVSVTRAAAEQGIEDVLDANQAVKFIENGQIIILKNGVRYNVQGQAVR